MVFLYNSQKSALETERKEEGRDPWLRKLPRESLAPPSASHHRTAFHPTIPAQIRCDHHVRPWRRPGLLCLLSKLHLWPPEDSPVHSSATAAFFIMPSAICCSTAASGDREPTVLSPQEHLTRPPSPPDPKPSQQNTKPTTIDNSSFLVADPTTSSPKSTSPSRATHNSPPSFHSHCNLPSFPIFGKKIWVLLLGSYFTDFLTMISLSLWRSHLVCLRGVFYHYMYLLLIFFPLSVAVE